jgi:hypothetical protein
MHGHLMHAVRNRRRWYGIGGFQHVPLRSSTTTRAVNEEVRWIEKLISDVLPA